MNKATLGGRTGQRFAYYETIDGGYGSASETPR
jgi:N-methylhydantoinase B/oxoprolinase/acetone carboxylase alpha subunit